MNRIPTELHKLIEFGLGGDGWQNFVNHYNEKYDKVQIDGFTFAPTTLSYTFSQLISNLGITTLPAYVDPESPGYEKALSQLAGKVGNIPTQKAFYRLNRVLLREKMLLMQKFGNSALTAETQDAILGVLDESTEGLIKGFYNSLTHQRMQIVSTGKFTISETNNPRGLKGITLDFGIEDSHFNTLAGQARWWTNEEHTNANIGTNADPIDYIKKRLKKIRRKHQIGVAMQLEMSQDLFDDLLTHPKVLARVGYSMFPTIKTDNEAIMAAQNYSDDALKATLSKLCGIDIVPRDTMAAVEKPGKDADGEPDLIVSQVENFKATNIAFVPKGMIGTIQGVTPLTLGYAPEDIAQFKGGRLILSQRVIPETHSIYIESEAAQICVPSTPQAMFIDTVTV